MPRPTIVCHMITSLDGRLLPDRWPVDSERLMQVYEGAADRLDGHGWIVGRRTMAEYVAVGAPASTQAPDPHTDRIADAGARTIAIAIDRQGRLRPTTGRIGEDHLVIVVSEQVAEDHVAELVAHGVSVVFAGPDGTDLDSALTRIAAAFGVERLLLEGGGTINGAFLDAHLIDETSTLVLPVIDGGGNVPAIFDHRAGAPRALELISTEALDGGTVWLRHRVRRD